MSIFSQKSIFVFTKQYSRILLFKLQSIILYFTKTEDVTYRVYIFKTKVNNYIAK